MEENISLQEFGAVQSGLNKGSEINLRSYLDQILTGKLVDKSLRKVKTQEEKDKLDASILKMQQDVIILEGKKTNFETNILPAIEVKINRLGEDKYTLPRDERFNFAKFFVLIISWLFLTAFLIYFYSSIAVNAFKKAFLCDTLHLLSVSEVSKIIVNNWYLLLVPSIFLALGVFLHYILDKKGKIKWIIAIIIIMFTFLLDFVIALYIHEKVSKCPFKHEIKPWHSDIEFWIIIIMGFLVYMLWSGVFHGWMEEIGKRDIVGRINLKISEFRLEFEKRTSEMNEIKSQIQAKTFEIENIKKEKDQVLLSKSDIKHSIEQFATGWLQPLTFESQIPLKQKCESVINDFKNRLENENL